jgi:DNA-binding response OmpR family regulator
MAEREPLILYVDDDPDYRMAVRQLLEANGLHMIEAADGESGFRAFREHKPDLVIVDLMMEEVDSGVNFMREVRATGSKTPVYLMSSVADALATTTNPADLGFAGVVQKPLGKSWLMAIVRTHFNA